MELSSLPSSCVCKDIIISFAGLHACIFSFFLSGFQTLPSFICCLLIAVSHVMSHRCSRVVPHTRFCSFFSSSLDSRALVCYHLLLFQTEGRDVTCVQSACTERWRSELLCEELITVTRLAAFHPSSLSILSSL